jgi:hypothetical protein
MTPALALLSPQEGLAFDELSHRYWAWSACRGEWLQLPSCSQVLSESGVKAFSSANWERSLINKQGMRPYEARLYTELHRDGRASIGTELHRLIRAELLGVPAPRPVHAESLMLLATWRREFLPRVEVVLACEQPMFSRMGFYSGTPDLVARVEGLWLVIDPKSKVSQEKARPSSWWRYQLAGYDLLVAENYGIELDGAANLMIWPDGLEEVHWTAADMVAARCRFIGHLAWSHAVAGAAGNDDRARALGHLLTVRPDALELARPPRDCGGWTVAEALGAGHWAVAAAGPRDPPNAAASSLPSSPPLLPP